MEMDVKTNHDRSCIEDEGAYPEALGLCDSYRDPELLPRIGDKFQVEIPPLLSKSAHLGLTESRSDLAFVPGASREFLVGLPVSLMWIKEKAGNIKHKPQEFLCHSNGLANTNECTKNDSTGGTRIFQDSNDSQVKLETFNIKAHNGIDLVEERKDELYLQHGSLVPGSFGGIWSDVEEASFLLGLYIFGKNFVQVNKFVETKDMGELLSFYYGRFYRSDKYERWSGCRKIRSRRCIYGQRIFSGSTQQELLSRLFLHASEDCQNTITEAAKAYGEGKMSLEEYVFGLKAKVGLNALVEAVGIGTGKQDLTGMATEHPKSNQVAPVRPEIPVGKGCSSLSPLEITNFLTGGYRLSKARSNDLFWEAVWPLLLARGWHSEQSRDHGFVGASRHSLVFLVPGVKKFSRRKLVKGKDYFDSVTDVLSKVASDPTLLELDAGVDNGFENGWTNDKVLDQGDFPDQQRHCYLKPRTPSRSADTMKFTVVDTSLPDGEETKVRELRSLPVDIMNIFAFRIDSEESDEDSSDDTADQSDSSDDMSVDENKTDSSKSLKLNADNDASSDKNSAVNNASKQNSAVFVLGFKVPTELTKDQKTGKSDDTPSEKPLKAHLAKRKSKTRHRKPSAPVAKRRRRLTACECTATSRGTINGTIDERLKQDEVGCMAVNPDSEKNLLSDQESQQAKLLSTSLLFKSSSDITDVCTFSSDYPVEHPNEKPQHRTLIDLNIPIPQDMENEPLIVETKERMDGEGNGLGEDSCMLKNSILSCHHTTEQPTSMNCRRQSTRNRPLTTKALEALACGFLSYRQKKHKRDDFPLDHSISRPSRRARSRMRITEKFGDGPVRVMDFKGDDRATTACNGNSDMLSELQV